ncbi:hypothetical protein LCGC14_1638300 [marine sediment metagenome]|uniref:Uncharacterized protein n=1 Tax=marine sediment metagenome TaxID=412755 RepID=A0A0F9KZZ0_9ZZZZ
MGNPFNKRIVPSILYNMQHGREKGRRFTDEKECLEALASGKWWKSWKGPDKEVEDWACKRLGWPTDDEKDLDLAKEKLAKEKEREDLAKEKLAKEKEREDLAKEREKLANEKTKMEEEKAKLEKAKDLDPLKAKIIDKPGKKG